MFDQSRAICPAKQFAQAKTQGRYVFLTGETDINRHETKANEAGYRRDGFRNTVYFEVPGMGHQSPGPQWLEKGLAFLDTLPGRKGQQSRPLAKTDPGRNSQ